MSLLSRPDLPPGPRGLVLVSLIPSVLRDPLRTICGLTERYGPVVCAGRGLFYVVWRPEHVERILVTEAHRYGKGKSVQTARPVFGDGLVMSDGDLWRRQRRAIQPVFHKTRLAALTHDLARATSRMLDSWDRACARGEPIDATEEMLRLLRGILLGSLFGAGTDGAGDLAWAQARVEEYIDRKAWNPIEWTDRLPTRANRDYRRAMSILESAMADLAAERRASGADRDDLLGTLLFSRDPETGCGMSERQIRDEMMTFFFTGHGTTAYALAWTLDLVARHPDAGELLAAEAREVLGEGDPEAEHPPRLAAARRVFEESLRLYPPAWVIARSAEVPDELGGHPIPAGAPVLMTTWVTHRHPEFWPDPERFDPDRFLPERVETRPRFAWYPFGGGQRQCIGQPLATIEAQLVLALVCRRYRLVAAPGPAVPPKTATVLKPGGPIRIRLERRGAT